MYILIHYHASLSLATRRIYNNIIPVMPGGRGVVAVVSVVVVVVVDGIVTAGQGGEASGWQRGWHWIVMVTIGDDAGVLVMETIGLGHIWRRGIDTGLSGRGGGGGCARGGHWEAVMETSHRHG